MRNTAEESPIHTAGGTTPLLGGRSVVLVGLMGAGKSAIGKRLALRLGLPFRDADSEIEAAAGTSVSDIFARYGEKAFREGERRVIRRLLEDRPIVLATGGGAFMDPETRALIRERAVSVWLKVPLATLVRRTAARNHRPLLAGGDAAQVLAELMRQRHPIYAEADLLVTSGEDTPEATTARVHAALMGWRPPLRVEVPLGARAYTVTIGEDLLARAGGLLAPVLPQRRAVVIADEAVAALHGASLLGGLEAAGFETTMLRVASGERSKSLEVYERLAEMVLAARVERRTAIIALGGGVVGDLAGFVAATVMRGLPFVQVPTTLLAQVDSSVGGKTGINTRHGKNLLGAFHQPLAVLADVATLATLPPREMRAGYAEIAKAGLIGDEGLFAWCEENAAALLAGERAIQAEAVARACAFKASVVAADEREQPEGGRALLNLGHTFAHALEAEFGFDGTLLHGEAVGIGLALAFRLSALLGHCAPADLTRVETHLERCGLRTAPGALPRPVSAERLIAHMAHDKKLQDGALTFVLANGIGAAFTSRDVPREAVLAVLRDTGCV